MTSRSSCCAGVAIGAVLLVAAASAAASPLDDPHIGGLGFSGPTTGDLAAVYWNPAAVGLISENQALVAGTARLTTLSQQRAPSGTQVFPRVTGRGGEQPVAWPPRPGAFVGLAAALGSRFTLAVAAYTPFAETVSWSAAPDGQQPTRYHALELDLRNFALVPALAIRLGAGIHIGAAPGFLFSSGQLTFDEDTTASGGVDCGGRPCGVEDPAAAARYRVASNLNPFDAAVSLTLGGGLHIDRERWALGLAYISRPLGTNNGVTMAAQDTTITPPPRAQSRGPLCRTASPCFAGQVEYGLPDTLLAGFTYRLSRRFDLGLVLRWLNLSLHDQIRIRIAGPATDSLRTAGLPGQIVLYRGFRDTLDTRVRATLKLGGRGVVGMTLRAQTAAVRPEAVSPAAVDGLELEPSLAAQIRITSWLTMTGGYAFAFTPTIHTGASVFDPGTALACQQAGGDLASDACARQRTGRARPSAAGTYEKHSHGLSLSLTLRL